MSADLVVSSSAVEAVTPNESVRSGGSQSRTDTKPSQVFADSKPLAELREHRKTYNIGENDSSATLSGAMVDHLGLSIESKVLPKKSLVGAESKLKTENSKLKIESLPAPAVQVGEKSLLQEQQREALMKPRRSVGTILDDTRKSVGQSLPVQETANSGKQRSNVRPSLSATQLVEGTVRRETTVQRNTPVYTDAKGSSSEKTAGGETPAVRLTANKAAVLAAGTSRNETGSQRKLMVSSDTVAANSTGVFEKQVRSSGDKPHVTGYMAARSPIIKELSSQQPVPDTSNGSRKFNSSATTKNLPKDQPTKTVVPGSVVAQGQVSDKSTKSVVAVLPKDKPAKDGEPLTSLGSTYMRTSDSVPTGTQATKLTQSSPSSSLSQNIAQQIAESVYASVRQGENNLVVRLNPPELGSVIVRFQQQSDQINGLLEVTRSQTRYEIEQALPQILKSLQDSGIQIKRLDVVLTDQAGPNADKDQLQQDAWSWQQPMMHHRGWEQDLPSITWMAEGNSYDGVYESQIPQGLSRIDMLA